MISFGGVVSAFAVSRTRLRLLFQVLATVATLGWVPGNPAKLMTMVVIWLLGFGRIRAAELVAMAAVNLLFVLMNQAALKQGTFVFDDPDLLAEALAAEQRISLILGPGIMRGAALVGQGAVDEAVAHIREGIANWTRLGRTFSL